MKMTAAIVPIAMLALAIGSVTAEGAQRERRSERATQRADRGRQQTGTDRQATRRNDPTTRSAQRTERRGREAAGRAEPQNRSLRERGNQANRDTRGRSVNRPNQDTVRGSNRAVERSSRTAANRGRRIENRRSYDQSRARTYRRSSNSYYAPRIVPRHLGLRRSYGSGGRLSLYFGWGSGYRYGSPYYGRVYGYRAPIVTGHVTHRYYGDLRLKITPRHAAVYVDGYYAGVVDDFDGFFQRLTLEVGPHLIEVEAPGLESMVFDVYVDPSRTVDLHGDLLRH